MYKKLLTAVLLAALIMATAACSPQNTVAGGEPEKTVAASGNNLPVDTSEVAACLPAPYAFASEAEFNAAILEAREQGSEDAFNIAEITEYCRPEEPLEGYSFRGIRVNDYYEQQIIACRLKKPPNWRQPGGDM